MFKDFVKTLPENIKEVLNRCKTTPQNPRWHPEGPHDDVPHNVYRHIEIVYERARKFGDIDMCIAALFHDLGKADTTKINKHGNWGSPGHEYVSCRYVRDNKKWIGFIRGKWFKVFNIVEQHMRVKLMDEMKPTKREKLLKNVWIKDILQFSEFDDMSNLSLEEMK